MKTIINKLFRFTGDNISEAPKNDYVSSVLEAYEYNVNNGGGEDLKKAPYDDDVHVHIMETDLSSSSAGSLMGAVKWNPLGGNEVEGNGVQSPATVLEHEVSHRYHKIKYPEEHKDLLAIPDSKFTNKEEARATKVENKTAIKNHEKPRDCHCGITVITEGPTSTKVNKQKTYELYKRLQKANPYYKWEESHKKYIPKN